LISQDITILEFILCKGLLDLESLNHTSFDFLYSQPNRLCKSLVTHLVKLNRRGRWPIHLFLNIRNQRADFVLSVDKDLALTGESLVGEIKVLQENHDGWFGGIGV